LFLNDNFIIVDGEHEFRKTADQLALNSMYRKKRAVASPFSLLQKNVFIQ